MSEMINAEILQRIRDQDGKIIDPISYEEIPDDKVWILYQNAENVIFTSIDTLYKNLVLNNSCKNPFDRSKISDKDITQIEEYGRKRKITVYFFDSGRNYNSKYRHTVYIFDWFVTIEQMFKKILKKTRNDYYRREFEVNGIDFSQTSSKDEIETLLIQNGERKIEIVVKLCDSKIHINSTYGMASVRPLPTEVSPANTANETSSAITSEMIHIFRSRPVYYSTSNGRRETANTGETLSEGTTASVSPSTEQNSSSGLSNSAIQSMNSWTQSIMNHLGVEDTNENRHYFFREHASRLSRIPSNSTQPSSQDFDGDEVRITLPSRTTNEVHTRNPRVLYGDPDGVYIENENGDVIFSDDPEVINYFRFSSQAENNVPHPIVNDPITNGVFISTFPNLGPPTNQEHDFSDLPDLDFFGEPWENVD